MENSWEFVAANMESADVPNSLVNSTKLQFSSKVLDKNQSWPVVITCRWATLIWVKNGNAFNFFHPLHNAETHNWIKDIKPLV